MNSEHVIEFKQRLQSMKKALESSITRLRKELDQIVSDDNVNDMEDLASLQSESAHHNALLQQQQRELNEVDHALSKLAEGTYGICERSGKKIPLERLRAEPLARFTIEEA